ncbi:N-acetylmuramidase domain-containing protein [Nitratireductor sp. GISD-1A_MAKvit]|uniref:N-acetylmuramidase domain-containing protein n=1 Tax=Nitratireductor sp. GISD-1A_MAKvit TaxID=3234198 RepID=UPI003467B7F9
MFSKSVVEEVSRMAKAVAIDPALLLAVAQVESGGRAHALVRGRLEPIIRFEGHYFDRRLSGTKLKRARAAGLSSRRAGGVANPRNQAERWALVERAAGIDRQAAYESVSWGVGQVMGAHWSWLGFADVEALVAEARAGISGQVRLMLRYIEKAGLKQALTARDWSRFAHGYNGPAYRRNQYAQKLARAYRTYANARSVHSDTTTVLREGMRGEAVEALQRMLRAAGYAVSVDGVFGSQTDAVLRRFQAQAGLLVDGVAGPETCHALKRAMPFGMLRVYLGSLWLRIWRGLRAGF